MIKFEKTFTMNFENAIRGARNPMNSWAKIDSYTKEDGTFVFGENDLGLAKRLCKAGSDHRKFIRQIFISVDITAPMYWWKEYSKPFEIDDFSHDKLIPSAKKALEIFIKELESLRQNFVETKDKDQWYSIIQLLPSSYNQTRTCTFSYENVRAMYFARKSHKLDEWRQFCKWAEELPYFKELFLENE